MKEQMTIEQIFAGLQAIADSIGPNCQERMSRAIQRAKDIEERASIKPAEPEGEPYPKCHMPEGAIRQMWVHALMNAESENQALRKFADGALQCERDAGQIVTRTEFNRAVGDRQKRDMAVATAVYLGMRERGADCAVNLTNIISQVK